MIRLGVGRARTRYGRHHYVRLYLIVIRLRDAMAGKVRERFGSRIRSAIGLNVVCMCTRGRYRQFRSDWAIMRLCTIMICRSGLICQRMGGCTILVIRFYSVYARTGGCKCCGFHPCESFMRQCATMGCEDGLMSRGLGGRTIPVIWFDIYARTGWCHFHPCDNFTRLSTIMICGSGLMRRW